MRLRHLFVMILGLVILTIGLEAGYRIGRQAEMQSHRLYIASLNLDTHNN